MSTPQIALAGVLANHRRRLNNLAVRTSSMTLSPARPEAASSLLNPGRRMDEGFGRLTESQRYTDERLNAMIAAFERYFSTGRQ
jgi:hypothetical protein